MLKHLSKPSENAAANKADNQADSKPSEELIVHNMPRSSRSGPLSMIRKSNSNGFSLNGTDSNKKSNVKTVGLVIIAGGVVVVALLVYLTYHFIIKPVAQPVANIPVVEQQTKNQTEAASTTPTEGLKDATSSTSDLNVTSTVLQLKPGVSPTAAVSVTNPNIASSSTSSSLTVNKASSTSPVSIPDSDNDGLNNLEEKVFGTSATSSDSDNDGYPDLSEIQNGYNPAGAGRLASDTALAVFHNTNPDYQIIYPKNWPESSVNNGQTVVFTAPNDSLFQISVQDNSRHVDIASWYNNLFSSASSSDLTTKSTATWNGIGPKDGSNFYLTDKARQKIFVFSYIPAVSGQLDYPQVFRMMIDSLSIGK